jgi:hypothetical protein
MQENAVLLNIGIHVSWAQVYFDKNSLLDTQSTVNVDYLHQ